MITPACNSEAGAAIVLLAAIGRNKVTTTPRAKVTIRISSKSGLRVTSTISPLIQDHYFYNSFYNSLCNSILITLFLGRYFYKAISATLRPAEHTAFRIGYLHLSAISANIHQFQELPLESRFFVIISQTGSHTIPAQNKRKPPKPAPRLGLHQLTGHRCQDTTDRPGSRFPPSSGN